MEPRIVAENQWIIAVDKPAGLIAHRDGRNDEPSLSEWLGTVRPELIGVGGAWVSPQGESIVLNGLAHRLDRTTSGIVLVAKTQEAFEYVKAEFKARRLDKTYHTILFGHRERDAGEIVAEIMRSKSLPKRWTARPCAPDDPRAAITGWRMLERLEIRGEPVSYIEAKPQTGRTHQLRVHFSATGNPIVGDSLYGTSESILGFARPMLHAYRVSLYLPDGEAVSYAAQLPEDFVAAIGQTP